ncbi:hypothetical protein [Psychroserpens jangbogonensis]|uniref:hypothetical protein n=1 Tax=Psychroserpens jangbogonensis TaxID=1484460 RepID=UPI00053D5316|nr:hypothetical protein [Psychroserpens jangbogonensis]
MINKLRHIISAFVNSKKQIPIIAGVSSGLYPLLHYCNLNFTYIETLKRVLEFIGIFIVIPVVLGILFLLITSNSSTFIRFKKYVIPFVNFCSFFVLIIISVFGVNYMYLIISIVVSIVLTIKFYKFYKKIIVVQLLMASIVVFQLFTDVYNVITYNNEWKQLPDDIEKVVFKKSPNVYFIQPDGYANFSELGNDLYEIENTDFESFLLDSNFKLYSNHRSNYTTTLHSNASVFMMKHHYYNFSKNIGGELRKARHMIAGNNPVHSIFKNNDYKTHLIVDSPYFLVNRPNLKFDYCNIDLNEIPYFSKGFDFEKDVTHDFKIALENSSNKGNNFFFIERYLPGHISVDNMSSKGKEEEKRLYQKRIKEANVWIKDLVNYIVNKDSNGIIIIMADHGGYVGFDYMKQSKTKQSDKDLVHSMFSSALAIKWPDGNIQVDKDLKSNVNLFRVLFSYLSDDKSYLNALENNSSYGIIKKDAPFDVYELIDQNGNVVFKTILN